MIWLTLLNWYAFQDENSIDEVFDFPLLYRHGDAYERWRLLGHGCLYLSGSRFLLAFWWAFIHLAGVSGAESLCPFQTADMVLGTDHCAALIQRGSAGAVSCPLGYTDSDGFYMSGLLSTVLHCTAI